MLTFELVICLTDNRLALSLGAYMMSVSMMGTFGSQYDGSGIILMHIVLSWLAVNESPLAVSMVIGGMSLSDWKSSWFPKR